MNAVKAFREQHVAKIKQLLVERNRLLLAPDYADVWVVSEWLWRVVIKVKKSDLELAELSKINFLSCMQADCYEKGFQERSQRV